MNLCEKTEKKDNVSSVIHETKSLNESVEDTPTKKLIIKKNLKL